MVRRQAAGDWKGAQADAASKEFGLLGALRDLGFEVPRVRALDASCELLPTPYYAMDFVEGTTDVSAADLPVALRQMADFLSRLHGLDPETPGVPQLPPLEDPREGALDYLPEGSSAVGCAGLS